MRSAAFFLLLVLFATLQLGCDSPQWSEAKKKDTLPAYGEYLCINDTEDTEDKDAKARINQLLEPIRNAREIIRAHGGSENNGSAVASLTEYLEKQFPSSEYNTTLRKDNFKEQLIKAIEAESPLIVAFTLKQHPLITPRRGNTRVVGYLYLVEVAGQGCTLTTDAFHESRKSLTLSGCGLASYSKVWLPGNAFGGKISGGTFTFSFTYQGRAQQSGHVSIATSYPGREGLW